MGVVGYVVLWSLDLAVRAAPPSRTAVFLFFQVLVVKFLTAAGNVDFRSRSLWLGTAHLRRDVRGGSQSARNVHPNTRRTQVNGTAGWT